MTATPAFDPALKRRLNAFHGAALIVGATIGSGIFTNPAKVFHHTGGAYSALCVWILGAVVAFFGAMVYGEWACRVPQSGGDAPFLDRAYRRPYRMVSFLYSLARVIFINPGYAASQATTCASYILTSFGEIEPKTEHRTLIAIGIMSFLTIICIFSNRMGSNFFLVLTLISVTIVLVIAFVGVLLLCGAISVDDPPSNFASAANPWKLSGYVDPNGANPLPVTGSKVASNVASSFVYALWAYDGWANLASAAGEIKNPQVNIPIANFVGIGCVASIYILANVAYSLVLDYPALVSGSMVTDFAAKLPFLGSNSKLIVSIFVIVCTFSCCFTVIYSASRIAQATGESDLIIFPRFFARINGRFGTPINALLANLAFSIIISLVLVKEEKAFDFIVDGVSFLFWMFCALTVAGLLVVKFREKSLLTWRRPAGLGVHVYFLTPAILLAIIILFLGCLFIPKINVDLWRQPYIINCAALCIPLFGLIPYFWFLSRGRFSGKSE